MEKSQYTKAAHKIPNLMPSDLFFEYGLLPFILAYVNVPRPTIIACNLFLPIQNTLQQKKTRNVYMDTYVPTPYFTVMIKTKNFSCTTFHKSI